MYLELNLLLYNISPYGFKFPHFEEIFFYLKFEGVTSILFIM